MANYMYVKDIVSTIEKVVSSINKMGIIDQIFSSVSAPEGCPTPWNSDDLESYVQCNQLRTKKPEIILLLFLGIYFILSVAYYTFKLIRSIKSGFRRIDTNINSNNRNTLNRLTIEGGSNFGAISERAFRSNGGQTKFQV